MPRGTAAEATDTREQLRTFHLSGRGLEDMRPSPRLRPAILDELQRLPCLESAYPVYIAPGLPPKALAEIVGASTHKEAILAAFHAAMEGRPIVALAEVRDAAFWSLTVEGAREDLRKLVRADGWLVSFRPEALPMLYAATLAATRGKLRAKFFDQLQQCLAGVEGLLAVDDAYSGPPSSEQISASLGMEAREFFKLSALAEVFTRRDQTLHKMHPDRRARCESTLATLTTALREHKRQPLFWLFHSGPAPFLPDAFDGQCRQSPDSCAAALDLCNQQLEWLVPVLRAMRIARLEVDSAFDSAVHGPLLERFEWQTADPEDLAALPAVVVMEPADRLAQMSLTSFSRLLRSGRPVQILAPFAGFCAEDLSSPFPDFGYLSIAHREAVVVQSSMVLLHHLLQGLVEGTRTLRPAVAIVSVPNAFDNEPAAWLETSLYILSRTFPVYLYNPDPVPSRKRFELFEPGSQFAKLTAAHAAALSKEFHHHFRVIPISAWDDEQMEIGEYLAKYEVAPPLAIPYLWITDEEGQRQRAVFTRELVNLCHDRNRAWEIFTELAGEHKNTGTPTPEVSQTLHEKARLEGAAQAIQAVLTMLADSDALPG